MIQTSVQAMVVDRFISDSGGGNGVGFVDRVLTGRPTIVSECPSAALPIGAYLPPVIMKPSHLDPREALDAFVDLHASVMVPIHFGTFDLAEEPLLEPPRLLAQHAHARGLSERVVIMKHGETRRW